MNQNTTAERRLVVIYARVSTEHEAQISALENQLDWYKPFLQMHPEWTLVDRYIDEGIAGTSAEKRPEFMRMIEDAKKHKFDMILTREVSRFARNTVDTLQYTRMLKDRKIEVYFINDGIKTLDSDGELRLTIMSTLAQEESRKTSIRVKSGQQTSMDNGVYYGNGNILGYDRVEQLLPDKSKEVDFLINPEQAETVRMIYDMYLMGYGLVKIKDELERRGRKTSQGMDKWFPTVISHVLKNSFYCGIMTYHKEFTPDYLKQKKVKNYGQIEFTQTQGKHEPLVTVEEFERVQRIMAQKRTECKNLNVGPRAKGKKPKATVWGKLLICECGHTFNMRKWDRPDRQPGNAYQCYNSLRTGSYKSRLKKGLPVDGICQSPMIPEWRLQMMANLIFRKYLSEKDKVLALANSILESYNGDTSDKKDREALLASVIRDFGSFEALVNNAGVAPLVRADLLEMTEESFDRVMNINLKGPFFLSQSAAKIFAERKEGVIVHGEYCISKAGIGMMTKLFAVKMAEFGVNVYEIRPGVISSDMTSTVKAKYDKLIAEGLTLQPRWGEPSDIGKAVAMLLRGDLAYSTGTVIDIGGGMEIARL